MVFKTVRDGERAQIIGSTGSARLVDGPSRIYVGPLEHFSKLSRYSATQKQYIRVQRSDGNIEHIPGPAVVFLDPIHMDSVEVKEIISLDADEVLVVYRREQTTGAVQRRVHRGPSLFVPSADEWLHSFVWHGGEAKNKAHKIPGALKFTRLKVIPDQFYYNVEAARTKDDALLTVKVMIFFELRDIEMMLNQTTDPIGDFINAVEADTIAFTSQLTYEEFIENSGKLNSLENYSQLQERAKAIGYEISKVVFRGYHATSRLQALHDHAVEWRTSMKVKMESEEKEQDLTDSKLLNEQQRNLLQQSLELEKKKHMFTLQQEQLVHKLKLEEEEHLEKLGRDKSKKLSELEAEKKLQEEQLAHLEELKKLGVDLTKYLLSQNPKPDQVLRVVTTGTTGPIHVHP